MPAPPLQLFDEPTQRKFPHLARYLGTLYRQEAWRAGAGVEYKPPARAYTPEKPWAASLDADGAAVLERMMPKKWSGRCRSCATPTSAC